MLFHADCTRLINTKNERFNAQTSDRRTFLPFGVDELVVTVLVDGDEAVVDDLEGRDQAEAHAQAQKAARVGHESDQRNLLITLNSGHNWILKKEQNHGDLIFWLLNRSNLDVHVDQGHVTLGVDKQVPFDEVVEGGGVGRADRLHQLRVVPSRVPVAAGTDELLGARHGAQVAADVGVVVGEGPGLFGLAGLDEFAGEQAELGAAVEGLGVGKGGGGLGDQVHLILARRKARIARSSRVVGDLKM